MKRNLVTRDQYLDAVAQKLQRAKKYLSLGPLAEGSAPLRDEQGLMISFANVMSIAENFYSRDHGVDVVADRVAGAATNFSGESYGNVSLVQTMGAIDVTIMTLANSLIPFLAVDRSMANPVDTVYYAQLVATTSAGGVSSGDVVMDNFAPPNPGVNLGPATTSQTITVAAETTDTFSFNEYLVQGQVSITLKRGATTYTGGDLKKDGNIYFNGIAVPGTVSYTSGAVVLTSGLTTGDVITVTVLLDTQQDSSGTNILKVRSNHVPLQLVSQPKQFIFEENEHSNMYMARIMAQAAKAGGITDYRDLYFSRLTNMYIEDINRDLIKILVTLSAGVTAVTLDLTNYKVGTGFAETKNDAINKFFINLRSDLIKRTQTPVTVVVTGTYGASLLQSHPTKWVPSPNFYSQLNGFVGTYDGTPVYRHNYLDSIANGTTADFYAATKLPDNSSGTMVFGEFLPLVQTSTVGNVSNPMMKSTGWFSQVGSQAINGTLVSFGRITYGDY